MNLRQQAKQEKKDRIRDFVEQYLIRHELSPSTQTIADAIGITKATVWAYLKELDQEGILHYDGRTITTAVSNKNCTDQVRIPYSGVIPCGTPSEQIEVTDRFFSMPRELFGPGEFFMLRASGDSMVDVGIDDGDLVIIRRTTEAHVGDIVAALVDYESTLKTLLKTETNRYYLHPENRNKGYQDIKPDTFSIQGVAVRVLKEL